MSEDAVEILLVEDSDEDAELALRALRKQKLTNQVHRVADGAEALEFLFGTGEYDGRNADRPPRVVLLDLKLPKLSGMEVLRRLRADPRTAAVPVVMLTSSREDRDLEEAYSLGVNSYIVKPVEFDKFVKAVEQLGLYWVLLNVPPSRPRFQIGITANSKIDDGTAQLLGLGRLNYPGHPAPGGRADDEPLSRPDRCTRAWWARALRT